MAIEGRKKALWRVYEAERDGLYNYARSLTRHSPSAEDAVHTAVANAAKANGQLREQKAYLYRAVRNEAIRLRKQIEGIAEADGSQPLADQKSPYVVAVRNERLGEMAAALSELGDADREVITLHIHGNLKFREIAELCEAPLNTVTSRYRRAIEKLRALLKEDER
jgi:RNA polymerase sigma-70 factor (ECF subfamily)